MKKINLQTLKGFRDFLPKAARGREELFNKIRSVFQKYGFLPLETPALEYKETLAGKYGVEEKLMYSFRDAGGREVALRYDLTVPLARVVAEYANVVDYNEQFAMPFKRYQIAPVWRAENPQRGRYREFTQCDVDVIGSSSITADADVIACIADVLRALDISDFVIRINNRKILDAILENSGIPKNRTVEAIRIIDKLEKIGVEKVREELALLGIRTKQQGELFELLNAGLEDPKDIEIKLQDYPGAGELAELVEILLEWGIKNYRVDLTLARGLDYYTGTIFEMIIPGAPQYGSIAGGGRYDNLVGMFTSPNPLLNKERAKGEVPAVGGSLGIDRLVAVMEALDLVKYDWGSDVLVCNLEENLLEKYLQIVKSLRDTGLKTDFYYERVKLDKQLKYADKKNINFAVIIGQDEGKNNEVSIKNLITGKQETVKQKDLVKNFQASIRKI